jgi:hypothetical protein
MEGCLSKYAAKSSKMNEKNCAIPHAIFMADYFSVGVFRVCMNPFFSRSDKRRERRKFLKHMIDRLIEN